MAALNKDETRVVGEARDLLKNIADGKPDLSNPAHDYFIRVAKKLSEELNTLYQMKGYYPS
jgi:hypothetical protein